MKIIDAQSMPEPEPIRDWVMAELTVFEMDLIEACLNACADQIAQVHLGPQMADKIKTTFQDEREHLAHVVLRQQPHGTN